MDATSKQSGVVGLPRISLESSGLLSDDEVVPLLSGPAVVGAVG
jgi:hypothetical protein